MTTPNKILLSLTKTPAVTQSIATEMKIPFLVAQAWLRRLSVQHLADLDCTGEVAVWVLTDAGREAAQKLSPELSLL